MQRMLRLDDLRLVRAIGEAGTLTGAARRLAVNHSTAFRRLESMEARLGVRLFERARDGYTPSAAGETAIAAAARVLADIGEVERLLAGQDLRPSGIVRVTTADTLPDFLASFLAGFRSTHPEITVEIVVSNAFFTLTRRDADVAIRPAATAPENAVGRRVARLATAPYAAPEYLARRPQGEDLRAHDWIGPDDSLDHLASARWMRAMLPPGAVVCRANSLMALRAAARAGLGVAPLPCYLGDPDPGLRRVQPPLREMDSALWLLMHPDLRRTARVRAFVDSASVWLAGQRRLIEGQAPQGDGASTTAAPARPGADRAGPQVD